MTLPTAPLRAAVVAILLAATAACSTSAPSASPGSSAGPTTAPTPTAPPVPDGIAHPTGATDVLLRLSESGGFVPIEFTATYAPPFTLYGDGTVVFRNPNAAQPNPVGGVNRSNPFFTVRLGEEGIQALLSEAIGPGGLGIAVGPYMAPVADLPATIFEITADGRTKTVSVLALSPEMHPQDVPIITALAHLAERLTNFANDIAGEQLYVPPAYRGTLNKVDQPFGPVIAWPWTDLAPADFSAGANEFLMTHTLTPAQVTTLGIPGVEGGLVGVTLQKDGAIYSFSLRPLLPDEPK